MKVDEMYQDVDRQHLMLLVDLICDSKYDPFAMFETYSQLWERKRADEGEVYFILKQPIHMYHEVHRQATIPEKAESSDTVIFHWMADVYLYALYHKGVHFSQSVSMVPPKWLYTHYSPMHETSLGNAWEKAVVSCGI